ncbi:transposase [Streptosporangium sp. NBC_01639]|uniref:transposase family protein n=1 Tax=Streptosporangium sp. NBC_01639 TaxID=2975948 RepID=UPI0038671633|nr:transposase [Streptosporangium sp. NBC_01639]WTD51909.1 transposase [Streptosporangium sp. NBC_01639]WTD52565.1 transposase [Streptosporangium sp. NBC_01639]
MITYRATLDVPRELVCHLSLLLAAERRRLGTRAGSRALTCFEQAVMGLRWFRDRTDRGALGRDHGVSRATAYRYIDEVIEVLADQAPDLHQALRRAVDEGLTHLILDGTVIATDRCAEKTISVKGEPIDLWYSGKARHHGGNIQALSAPCGLPLWVSAVEPGSVHDLTAARAHVLGALYKAAADGLPTLADSGYDGAGIGIFTPVKQPSDGRPLDLDTRTRNALLRALRCLGERGFALLTQRWRTLQRITASPSRIGDIIKAALVLTHFEHGYLT